jgi:rRNA-processing protein FCF1
MNWHLIKQQEAKVQLQVTIYESVLNELKRIAEKESVTLRVLVRSAINWSIEEYHKLEVGE